LILHLPFVETSPTDNVVHGIDKIECRLDSAVRSINHVGIAIIALTLSKLYLSPYRIIGLEQMYNGLSVTFLVALVHSEYTSGLPYIS
jgi:hypothetical protein